MQLLENHFLVLVIQKSSLKDFIDLFYSTKQRLDSSKRREKNRSSSSLNLIDLKKRNHFPPLQPLTFTNSSMDPQLFNAATNGDLGHLQILTSLQKSNLEFQLSPNQNTPLHVATEFRQLGFAKAVVGDCQQLVWLQNGAGDTALHVAARKALVEFVEFFIGFGPTLLRMVNLDGDTALHCAARIGSSKCVEKIVEAESELCGVVNNNGESPLYLAVAAGYWEVPQVIIGKAESLASYKGANGLTALHPTLFYPNYGNISSTSFNFFFSTTHFQ